MNYEVPPPELNELKKQKSPGGVGNEQDDTAPESADEQKISEEKFEADVERQKPGAVERIADIPVKEIPEVDDREKGKEAFLKKEWLNGLVDSARRVIAILKSRETDNFNPLIMPDKISRLSGAVNGLEDLLHGKEIKTEDLNNVFSRIVGVIDAIGDVPRLANMRDDEKSLGKAGFSLRALEDECQTLASRIGKLEADEYQVTSGLLKKIRASSQEKQMFVARRRDALGRYLGR